MAWSSLGFFLGRHRPGEKVQRRDERQGRGQSVLRFTSWHVPTLSVVYVDVEGHIGYQAVGRIPLRGSPVGCFRDSKQDRGIIPLGPLAEKGRPAYL